MTVVLHSFLILKIKFVPNILICYFFSVHFLIIQYQCHSTLRNSFHDNSKSVIQVLLLLLMAPRTYSDQDCMCDGGGFVSDCLQWHKSDSLVLPVYCLYSRLGHKAVNGRWSKTLSISSGNRNKWNILWSKFENLNFISWVLNILSKLKAWIGR
jgi:hypothetical protein